MRAIWSQNLKDWITATNVGGKNAFDVNVANTISTAAAAFAYKERRVHFPATTNIPASASSMIELDLLSGTTGGTAISNTCAEMGINWNGDGIIEIGVGANAGAAAAAIIATCGAGQTKSFGVSLVSTNKVWVRAVKNAVISDGELVVTFSG